MSDTPAPPVPAFSRPRLRWAAAPLAAALLVGGFGLAPSLAGTDDPPPALPAISAQDLVAKVTQADVPGLSGKIKTATNLGLPSLSSLDPGSADLLGTLLSPHTVSVWAADGGKLRLSVPDSLAETTVVSDGTQVWLWNSRDQTVSHLVAPPDGEPGHAAGEPHDRPPGDMTPAAMAQRLLDKADATTRVFVRGTATVAGRPAYELALAPRSSETLVADAVIDVDADTGLPLRVQVLARDASTPALDVSFTEIAFNTPPASTFTFTPPPGATVREVTSPEELLAGDAQRHRRGDHAGEPGAANPAAPAAPDDRRPAHRQLGSGWETVLVLTDTPSGLAELGRPVSGPWGSGRLLTSSLADALVLDDGTILVGLVGPGRLEAAASELKAGS